MRAPFSLMLIGMLLGSSSAQNTKQEPSSGENDPIDSSMLNNKNQVGQVQIAVKNSAELLSTSVNTVLEEKREMELQSRPYTPSPETVKAIRDSYAVVVDFIASGFNNKIANSHPTTIDSSAVGTFSTLTARDMITILSLAETPTFGDPVSENAGFNQKTGKPPITKSKRTDSEYAFISALLKKYPAGMPKDDLLATMLVVEAKKIRIEARNPDISEQEKKGLLKKLRNLNIYRRRNSKSPIPDDIGAHVAFDMGNHEDAVTDATSSIAKGGGSSAYAIRSAAHINLGDKLKARADANEALRLDPDNKLAHSVLMLSEGRAPKLDLSRFSSFGASAASQAPGTTGPGWGTGTPGKRLELDPRTETIRKADRHVEKAKTALGLGDYGEAVREAGRAIELDPKNAKAYNRRATAFNRMKRYDQAAADAFKGLALFPENMPLLTNMTFASNRRKDYQTAMKTAQKAISLDPRDAYSIAGLALAQGGLGDREAMIKTLRRAAVIDPRFEGSLAMAMRAPEDSDVLFLFPGESANAPMAAPRTASAGSSRGWIVLAASLIGGFLVALGLLHLSKSRTPPPLDETAARAVPGPDETQTPSLLDGKYEIIRQIGEGGMGVVYEGRDRSLTRPVAIKKMRPELKTRAKDKKLFISEARTVANLKHPNIVDIYSIVEEKGEIYLIFELVDGLTLDESLSQKGRLTLADSLPLLRGVAAALDFAHGRNIIHRDLKPSNIILSGGTAKVMDFGIARAVKDSLDRLSVTRNVMGTPLYMAPEAERGEVRKSSDIYSFGICVYEILSGNRPFSGSAGGMLQNKLNRAYVPLSNAAGLPQSIDALMAKAMDPDPAKRFPTAMELVTALGKLS